MKKLIQCIMLLAGLALNVNATLIEFTADEGFTNGGGLNWHDDWNGSPANTVDTTGTGSAVMSTEGWDFSRYNRGVTGESVSFSSTFRFTHTSGTPSGIKNVFGVDVCDESTVNSTYLSADFRRAGAHWYDLKIFGGNGITGGNDSGGFHESAIGINEGNGDYDSDLLKITTTVTRGTFATDWAMTIVLSNLTTGLEIEALTDTSIAVDAAFHASSVLYGGINSMNSDADSLATGRHVESFEVIPEPATLGLFAISSAGIIMFRKVLSY